MDQGGLLTLYLDGSSYATGTAYVGSISNANPLTLGSDGSNGLYLTGSLDDVRVYGLALNNTEASELYSGSAFSNSFYGNSISPSIHDALIGQADFQNGIAVTHDKNFGTAINRAVVISANTQYTSNQNFTSLTVMPGVTLDTCGNILRVNGTLTNYGTITDTCDGGASGRAGRTENGYTGGWGGGAGGAGGGGAAGGSGGAGGGIVMVYALQIVNLGSINANGQDGRAGSMTYSGQGGGGGGGGGEGGQVYLYYLALSGPGTTSANGGSRGNGGSGAGGSQSSCYNGASGGNNGAGSGSPGSGGACSHVRVRW